MRTGHMSRRYLMMFVCITLTALILVSKIAFCQNEASYKLSIEEVEKLVKKWVEENKDQFLWQASPRLKEVTTKDISERLHAQVFKLFGTSSITEVDSYLAKDGKIYPMSIGLGGVGLAEMCVSNVDNDSNDEMIYTYSWGSGIHRSHVDAYIFTELIPLKVLGFDVWFADLSFRRLDDKSVDVYIIRQNMRLGKLYFGSDGKNRCLDIKLDPSLPKSVAVHRNPECK